MPDFPKLLVATEFPPNVAGGGGAIVRQMLKDWPADKLYWWSCEPDRSRHYGQRVAAHAVATIPPKLYPFRKARALKCLLLEKFWTPWAARHFRKTLAEIQPEAIWVIPHRWGIPTLAKVLLHENVPFHFSIYDYADIQTLIDVIGVQRAKWFAELTDKLYARAVSRDTVSQQMTDDLRAHTGCDAGISRCGLEREDFDYLAQPPETQNGPIRIGYAGTIIAGKTFAAFAKALGRIRDRLPQPVTLEFFGDHSYRAQEWFEPGWMNEHGNLTATELSRALKDCTWGFSPMELTDDNARYNRFSLPTKFVSYLAAGLPVISLGHPESTIVKMASQYGVGLCATSGDPETLGQQLLAALAQPEVRRKYRAEILRCAVAEFDARRMRATLHENFRKCASTMRGGSR